MLEQALHAGIEVAALASALQIVAAQELTCAAGQAAEGLGKGASRCLRSMLGLLIGEGALEDGGGPHVSMFDYATEFWRRFLHTAATAFHGKSYWSATALLDLHALFAVWRRHRDAHAEAAAAASVRHAAHDPANSTTHLAEPAAADLPLLLCAAAHSKAAYGAVAAAGICGSAGRYLAFITLGQATPRAARHIPSAQHLAALQQLTGVPPADVLAAQWQSHLHWPAFYVAADRARRAVVVCVRGTLQLGDFCTVLDAVPQPITLCGVAGHVHGGFLAAARSLLAPVAAALQEAARRCPDWPVLVTGHSLGGGVAAVLTMLLLDQQQQQQQQQQGDPLSGLGEVRCVGIGAAAAFCEVLGLACKRHHVTSVLYGADCLPMFSVLGARLLIEEVHAKSKAAALVGGIVRHARGGRGGGGHSRTSSCASDTCVLGRTVSAASSATADSVADLSEIEEARGEGGSGGRLHRCSSAWSSASTTSIAAFAADAGCTAPAGDALVPMFPPGRILWMLPDEGNPSGRPQLVETDQTAFERFLLTLETCQHHLPDQYCAALASLTTERAPL